jgi:hypothetical protein
MTLRIALVGLAALSGALLAHVAIDIAGDYVLARDAYDGIAHASRGILFFGLVVLALAVTVRVIFDLLNRSCKSKTSLLGLVRQSLGSRARFIAQSIALCIVALCLMELFDCFAAHTALTGISGLFGGSYALGLTLAAAAAALTGSLVHGAVTIAFERQSDIAALFRWIVRLGLALPNEARRAKLRRVPVCDTRALVLAARGRKRGPPLPIPG